MEFGRCVEMEVWREGGEERGRWRGREGGENKRGESERPGVGRRGRIQQHVTHQ